MSANQSIAKRQRLNLAGFIERCDFCGAEFEPRTQGSPQKFCPGGKHRRAFDRQARRIGAQILRGLVSIEKNLTALRIELDRLGTDPGGEGRGASKEADR